MKTTVTIKHTEPATYPGMSKGYITVTKQVTVKDTNNKVVRNELEIITVPSIAIPA